MELQVVGVGFGRTGTNSLKLALEQLLDGRCHHMLEVFQRPGLIDLWVDAARGRPDWAAIFDGDVATVDWPGAAFWRQLVAEYPDAKVLLSKRASADEWWASASNTIFVRLGDPDLQLDPWMEAFVEVLGEQGVDPRDEAASKAAYERHLEAVRAEVPADRLIEWTAGDGWGPLCEGLGVPVPDEPFPHVNTTDEFRARAGIDG